MQKAIWVLTRAEKLQTFLQNKLIFINENTGRVHVIKYNKFKTNRREYCLSQLEAIPRMLALKNPE